MTIDAFASRTGTKRNLAALREAGWGLFVAAAGVHRHEGFRFWAENSAYTWGQRGLPFQVEPWQRLLDSHGRDPLCEGIVAPDIVCGGAESLELTLSWLERLLDYGPRVYLPVQPGIAPREVAGLLGERVGLFVGGDSEWKEATCASWARLAHEHGARCHVGRVNSRRRLLLCKAAGVDSFDGSGPSRFEVVLHEMERFRGEVVQLGLMLQVSAWVFFTLDGASLWVELDVPDAGGLDVLLLIAWNQGARDIHEIQVEGRDGAYEARGAGFVFVTSAEWDARG